MYVEHTVTHQRNVYVLIQHVAVSTEVFRFLT